MNFCRIKSQRGMSLAEVLVSIIIIATSILLSIRVYPYLFTLNRQVEDINVAKNLTEQLFQNLRSELGTVPEHLPPPGTREPLYYSGQRNLIAHNIINPYKCFWQLVVLTQSGAYSPEGLDTLVTDAQFNNINPSIFEPSPSDWVVGKQFWVDWRNMVQTQLPPYNAGSSERASARVTARYLQFSTTNNDLQEVLGSSVAPNFTNLTNLINDGSGYPQFGSEYFMMEVTVSIYWRPRKLEGTYNRSSYINKPNYKLSTLLIPRADDLARIKELYNNYHLICLTLPNDCSKKKHFFN